jgi:hypothetical protein
MSRGKRRRRAWSDRWLEADVEHSAAMTWRRPRKPDPDCPRPRPSEFEAKRSMEEATHPTCPDCGYAGGRHARSCQL